MNINANTLTHVMKLFLKSDVFLQYTNYYLLKPKDIAASVLPQLDYSNGFFAHSIRLTEILQKVQSLSAKKLCNHTNVNIHFFASTPPFVPIKARIEFRHLLCVSLFQSSV